jgi:two-component system response regulator
MSFTRQIKAESGALVCSFIKSRYSGGVKYHINVVDANYRANLLTMELISNRWRIADAFRVPRWIRQIENQLELAILEGQQFPLIMPSPRTVLHIDDDEDDRLILEGALKKLDTQIIVQQADCGSAALSYLQQSKQFQNLPSLVVLDLNMPGMNGTEVIKEMKKDEKLASLPLVIFTTTSENGYKDFLAKENIALLTKPSSPCELVERVRTMLSYCHPN